MKKLLLVLLSIGLIFAISPASHINASDDNINYQQQKEEKVFNIGISGIKQQNNVYLIQNNKCLFELNFPEEVNITGLKAKLEVIKGKNIISVPYYQGSPLNIENEKEITDHAYVKGYIIGQGNTTVKLSVINSEDSSVVYSDTISIKVDIGKLFASKTEFNLSTDQLAISDLNGTSDITDVVEQFTIGFKKKDGTIVNLEEDLDLGFKSSNSEVALYTNTITHWNDKQFLPTISNWEHYKEFERFYWERAKSLNSKFTSISEFMNLLKEFEKINGFESGGIAFGVDGYREGIIARNPGTSYITLTFGDERVTVKVNVSNLSNNPLNKVPSNLQKEYYSEANKSIKVNLSKPDKITRNIFQVAKETKKDSVFNILNDKGTLEYGWTFEGGKITRTDIDVNLAILKNKNNVNEIKRQTNLSDVLVLNFIHSGKLPAPVKIKMFVGNEFKAGEQLYLNYWNDNKKMSTEIDNSLVVNNGYVEFNIEHCSTYFLSKEKINSSSTNINNLVNDKNQATNQTNVPKTGINDNSELYLMLSVTSLIIITYLISINIFKRRIEE